MNTNSHKWVGDKKKASRYFLWFILFYGFFLRVSQYIFNRSLWVDEVSLALNIIHRSFGQLLSPLDYHQAAPPGFLFLEKLSVLLLGEGEKALRLFPFLFGILSLCLFAFLAAKCLKPGVVPIALGLFAVTEYVLYFSSEAKPYILDVAISLLIWLSAVAVLRKPNRRHLLYLMLSGLISLWFSYSSIFLLAGCGLGLVFHFTRKKDRKRLLALVGIGILWIADFAVLYFSFLNKTSADNYLSGFWEGSFMPFPPTSVFHIKWLIDNFFALFQNPGGLFFSGLGALAFLIGSLFFLKEKKDKFLIYLLPLFFALIASAMKKYPFNGRFLLFFTPVLYIFIAEGIDQMRSKTRNFPALGILLMGLLFFHPLFFSALHLIRPVEREEMKPVMKNLQEHYQKEHVIYVFSGAYKPYLYYSRILDFHAEIIRGTSERKNMLMYLKDMEPLWGKKRVWLLFSHVNKKMGIDAEMILLQYLDARGKRLSSFQKKGASLYLYDLSEEK